MGVLEYYVNEVNSDNKQTATLMFDNCCIHIDDSEFKNYKELNEADKSITNYLLSLFKEDHKRHNKYISMLTQPGNDVNYFEKKKKKAEENAKKVSDNKVSDLEKQIDNKVPIYTLLKEEFTQYGDIVYHVLQHGVTKGKVHKKQESKHKHLKYTFICHHQQAKAKFDTSQLWKDGRQVTKIKCPGFIRLAYLFIKIGKQGGHPQ